MYPTAFDLAGRSLPMITIHVEKDYGSSAPAAAAAPSRYKRKKRMSKLITTALLGLVLGLVMAPAAFAQTGASPVEGESFTKPPGTQVVLGDQYSGGKALKITSSQAVPTKKQVTITETSNVLVRARAGQTGGSPTLAIRVNGDNAGTRRITSASLADYLYGGITLQPGTYTIGLKGGNLDTGRNVFVDVVKFPSVAPPGDTTGPVITFDVQPDAQTQRAFLDFRFTVSDASGVASVTCIDKFTSAASGEVLHQRTDNLCSETISYEATEDGTFELTVIAKDAAGNETTVTKTVVVDMVPAPTITSPSDGATVGDPITVTGEGNTPGNLIAITGNIPSGASLAGAQTTVNADGTWSVTFPAQGEGQYTLRASEHRPDGHRISPYSTPINVTVDNTP